VADDVRALARLNHDAVLAGRTDLADLAALVAGARLVVCGDTGVAHLASAYATPSVVLFGPVSPALWGPPVDGPHITLWRGGHPGDPWAERPDPSLLLVDADDVIEHAERLLDRSPPVAERSA
jgi:ADP-heptose:LPS heptosyltransferase